MDFERISLLLGIVHNSINVPGTERLRDNAIKELQEMNSAVSGEPIVEVALPVEEVPVEESVQEEIKVEGRRL